MTPPFLSTKTNVAVKYPISLHPNFFYMCYSTWMHVSQSRAHFLFISSLNHGVTNIYPFSLLFSVTSML